MLRCLLPRHAGPGRIKTRIVRNFKNSDGFAGRQASRYRISMRHLFFAQSLDDQSNTRNPIEEQTP